MGALADCEIPDKLVLDFGETEYQARLLEAHGKVCEHGSVKMGL